MLDKVDRRLHGQVKVRDDECEFELFLEVFEFLALWVADVETLREDPAYVHVMLPNQVLHVVSETDFSRNRSLPKDVIDLLVWREGDSEDVTRPQKISEVESLRGKVLFAILDFLPIVLDHASPVQLFAEDRVLADHFEYLGLRGQTTAFLVGGELLS